MVQWEKRFFLLMMLNATLWNIRTAPNTLASSWGTHTIINDSVFRRAGRSLSDLTPTELSKFNKCFTLVQFIRIPVKSRRSQEAESVLEQFFILWLCSLSVWGSLGVHYLEIKPRTSNLQCSWQETRSRMRNCTSQYPTGWKTAFFWVLCVSVYYIFMVGLALFYRWPVFGIITFYLLNNITANKE